MSEKLSLALLIIVKNETANITNAILSVKNIVDQIVVVDTGSDDDTPLLASRLGAEVYFKKWSDNFSESRNFGLSHVREKWVLSLDADEFIDEKSISELINVIQKLNDNQNTLSHIGGINVLIHNALGTEETAPSFKHRYTRLFKSDKNIRFRGRIHEQIRPSIEQNGLEILDSEITIIHTGYSVSSEEKMTRNKSLLELELAENPFDNWLKFHLGETTFSMSKFDEAYSYFSQCVDNEELSLEQNERVHIRLAQIALSKDNFQDMVKWLSFQSENIDIEGLRRFVLASGLIHTRKFSAALDLYLSNEVQTSNYVDKIKLKSAVNVLKQIPGIS